MTRINKHERTKKELKHLFYIIFILLHVFYFFFKNTGRKFKSPLCTRLRLKMSTGTKECSEY